jgi:signal transduction histidine kinase
MSTTTIYRRVLPSGWYRRLGRVDVALAFALSVAGVCLVSGVAHTGHPHGGFWASAWVLTLTVPVAWRRPAPLAAVLTVAVGAWLAGLLTGSIVRCGVALPALFLITYSVGARLPIREASMGLAFAVVAMVGLVAFDPNIGPLPGLLPGGAPFLVLLWGIGRVVRSRERMVSALRARTRELGEERERTARLAVASDRARVISDVQDLLDERIGELADAARDGRAAVDAQPQHAAEVLGVIERDGRETLEQMRAVVGSLRDEAPLVPAPGLSEIDGLLARATTANAHLRVEGEPRELPAGIELSAYRIVEHVLGALADDPAARVEVRVQFRDDALEIVMSGPPAPRSDPQALLAAVGQRVALYGGSMDSQTAAGRLQTNVRLPLVTAYA